MLSPAAGLYAVRDALGGGRCAAAPFGMLHSQIESEPQAPPRTSAARPLIPRWAAPPHHAPRPHNVAASVLQCWAKIVICPSSRSGGARYGEQQQGTNAACD